MQALLRVHLRFRGVRCRDADQRLRKILAAAIQVGAGVGAGAAGAAGLLLR